MDAAILSAHAGSIGGGVGNDVFGSGKLLSFSVDSRGDVTVNLFKSYIIIIIIIIALETNIFIIY